MDELVTSRHGRHREQAAYESAGPAVTYVDGLPGVLSQVSQIQATVGSAAPLPVPSNRSWPRCRPSPSGGRAGALAARLDRRSCFLRVDRAGLTAMPGPSTMPGVKHHAWLKHHACLKHHAGLNRHVGEATCLGSTDMAGSTGVPGSTYGPCATDLSDSYGWPLEEGATVFPAASGRPPEAPAAQRPGPTRVRATTTGRTGGHAGSAFYGGLEQATSGPDRHRRGSGGRRPEVPRRPLPVGGHRPHPGRRLLGLVQDVYGRLGISLPRTSQEQATVGMPVPAWPTPNRGTSSSSPGRTNGLGPGHVGIYIGNGR